MRIFEKIADFLNLPVRVSKITKVRVLDQVFPLVCSTTHGVSEGHKTTYTIRRETGELVEVESMDIQEFISEKIWIPRDSS